MKTYKVLVDIKEDNEWRTNSLFIPLDPYSKITIDLQAYGIVSDICKKNGIIFKDVDVVSD